MEQNLYSTRDLIEAASLIALKFPMVNIDYQSEDTKLVGYFVFEDSPELQEMVIKSLSKQLAFEPREFNSIIKSLKAQLANTKKSPSSKYSGSY